MNHIFRIHSRLRRNLTKKNRSNARLLICDATSMYKITRSGLALHRIGRFSLEEKNYMAVLPVFLMDALRLLMTNNVFRFGDTYWLKKVGTVVGATPVPPWETIFFSIHEEAVLAQFGDMLQLYCHFINNVLRIWIINPDPAKDHQK